SRPVSWNGLPGTALLLFCQERSGLIAGWAALATRAQVHLENELPGGDLLQVAGGVGGGRKEKPPPLPVRVSRDKAPGGDLLLHGKATLPSAHARFTSEFGMGSGGPRRYGRQGRGGSSARAPA